MSGPLAVCRFAVCRPVSTASVHLGIDAAAGLDVMGLPGKGMFLYPFDSRFLLCSCCRSPQVSKAANSQRLGPGCRVPAGVHASPVQVCRSRQHREG